MNITGKGHDELKEQGKATAAQRNRGGKNDYQTGQRRRCHADR